MSVWCRTIGRGLRPLLSAAAAALLTATSASAEHTVFSYTAEGFELSGAQGSLVDDFGDGVLAPWVVSSGTAADTGAGLVLSDLGDHVEVTSPFWSDTETRDVSGAIVTGITLADGSGDFLLESTWSSGLPLEDQLNGMTLILANGTAYTMFLAHWSDETAARATHPLPGGVYAWFVESTQVSPPPDIEIIVESDPSSTGHLVAIEDTPTGDQVLRIGFVDATNTLSGSFSIDGGASFEFLASYTADPSWSSSTPVNLFADPIEVLPEPSGPLMLVAGVLGLAAVRKSASRRRARSLAEAGAA